MSNLIIGYPDIAANASRIITNMADPASYLYSIDEFRNKGVGYGRRKSCGYHTGTSPLNWTFDLGSTYTSKQNTCNYWAITRADMLQTGGTTTLTLRRSSDNSTYTTERTLSSFGSLTLKGPRTQDYFETFTATSAYRYWRVEATGPTTTRCGKFYFGSYFAPSTEPDFRFNKTPASDAVSGSDGSDFIQRNGRDIYDIELTWDNLTESEIQTFSAKILYQSHKTDFALMTTAQNQILDDCEIMEVALVEHSISKNYYNNYSLSTLWRESWG